MKIRQTSILLAIFMVFGLMLNTGAIFAHDDFPGAVRDNANVPTENAGVCTQTTMLSLTLKIK